MNLTDLLQLVAAIGIGLGIGVERRLRKTDMCTCPSSYVYAAGAEWMITRFSLLSAHGTGVYWPLAAAGVSGLGFASAAYVNRRGTEVQGVTTAIIIFLASCAGTACGLGYPLQTAEATGLLLAVGTLTSLVFQEH